MTDDQLHEQATAYVRINQVPPGSRSLARADYVAGFKAALALVYKQLNQCITLDCESATFLLDPFKDLL